MVYKDKDKQREANKLQMRRARAAKSNTKQANNQSNTGYPRVTDQDFTRRLATLPPGSPTVRVSKPGDADYEPQCETTKAFVEGRDITVTKVESHVDASDISTVKALHQLITKFKRGRDIKTFEDLPPDVQQTIKTVSESNEEFQRRTVIAIAYQHTFPGRY